MARNERRIDDASSSWRSMRQRLRLECRECEVICERVVSPWHCLKSGCPYVYVFEERDTSYFGCLHKVFAPELDLAAFTDANGANAGSVGAGGTGTRGGRSADPYGHLRVNRSPRPECAVTIEQAYAALATPGCCCNPTFFLHPAASAQESIRLTSNVGPGPDSDADDGRQE